MTLSLLVLVLKITCVLLIALCATLAMQRASAGSRHLVWLLAVGALLVLPPLAAWAPIPVAVLPATTADNAPARMQHQEPVATVPAVTSDAVHERERAGGTSEQPASRSSFELPAAGTLLLGIWALVAVALLGRLAWGAWSVRRIVSRARTLADDAWQTPLYEIADRLGLDEAPRLLQSDDVKMPFASGLFDPVIVLPAESESWVAERRSAVLVHELGHVRRRDLVGHTLGRIACAVYWFHPLVWTAARRLRAESEQACDDLALVFGARPSDYAEHLLDIVTCVRDHYTPSVALAMAHRKEFEGRMLAILNPELQRRGPTRKAAVSYALALAGLSLVIGAAAPVPRAPGTGSPGLMALIDSTTSPADTAQRTTLAVPADDSAGSDPAVDPDPDPDPALRLQEHVGEPAGDLPDDKRAEVLARVLQSDTSAEVRRIAAWGLEEYAGTDVAVNALVDALENDPDAGVREMSAWALAGASRNSAAGAALVRSLQDGDAGTRATAVWALGGIGDPNTIDALVAALDDTDPGIRELAAWSIGNCDPDRAPPALVSALSDSDPDVRLSVAWALYEIEDPSAGSAIDAALRRETDNRVQLGMIRALGSMGDMAVDALERLVVSPDSTVRAMAIRALAGGSAGGPWPWPRPYPRPFP